jgi:hypothetical protein
MKLGPMDSHALSKAQVLINRLGGVKTVLSFGLGLLTFGFPGLEPRKLTILNETRPNSASDPSLGPNGLVESSVITGNPDGPDGHTPQRLP